MKVDRPRKLTPLQKKQIWEKIELCRKPDDRDPLEVITSKYSGDVDSYLRKMKTYLGMKENKQ